MYGKFSDDKREFHINKVDTPRPWANYLFNRDGTYVSLLSHNAGGYSYLRCPKDGRLTRWRYNSLPEDRPGKYLYLRTPADGDYWTLSWQPVGKPQSHYRVRHGQGYSVFECNYKGIVAEAMYFVPLDDPLEAWAITLKNTTGNSIALEIFPYAELCLGNALIDLVNKPDDQHFSRLWFDKKANSLFATRTYWITGTSANRQENKAWDRVAFMSSTLPAKGYAGHREVFAGPYRDERNPRAIENGQLASTPVASGNLVASLKHELVLAPGKQVAFHILLGAAEKQEGPCVKKGIASYTHSGWEKNCRPLIRTYLKTATVQKEFARLKKYWTNYLDHVHVDTPSENMNTFLNVWNAYQAKVTFLNSRNASYHQWGITRGMGFRDSLQDTLGVVIQEPDLVRKRILQIAHYQRSDGLCMHLFHPVSGEGEFTGHKDDPLWLITAAWYYLAETGDYSILDASVPFHDGKKARFLDHLLASIKFIDDNRGPRGIPTFGRGDWNDTLDYVGGQDGTGESIWAGMFYAYNIQKLIDILQGSGKKKSAIANLTKKYDAVKKALNKHAWDGAWYTRAVCADGKVLGSKKCFEGKIFINPQTWSVLSGVADGQRGERAMASVKQHLDCPVGPKLVAPAYHEIDPAIGLITRCVWGKKENGSVFNHTVTWTILAECSLGHGRQALAYYEKTLPYSFDQRRFEIEPYVYSQYTTSDAHETCGQGSHAWLTGTSAWMFRAAVDGILGLEPTLAGLKINPCISPDWNGFTATRKYHGTMYRVTVSNPHHTECGVASLIVNGKPYDVKTPLPIQAGKVMNVEVTLK